jgi:hypothetical protein
MKMLEKTTATCVNERITIIPFLIYVYQTELEYPDHKESLNTVSLTPFIQFTIRTSKKNLDPNAPPKIKKGQEIVFFDGVKTLRHKAAGPAEATGWEVPLQGDWPGESKRAVWDTTKRAWIPIKEKSSSHENSP